MKPWKVANSERRKARELAPIDPAPARRSGIGTLRGYMEAYHQWMREMNYSEWTVKNHRCFFGKFLRYCEERGITNPADVSQALIERYQKSLYYARSESGALMSNNSQRAVGSAIMIFFRWMKRRGHMAFNPAADIDLPRKEFRLPEVALSIAEIERVLAEPDLKDPLGIRDRTMMEVLYSSGIRREELVRLRLYDIDPRKGTLAVRLGKGKRDRFVPIGERALAWVEKYASRVRPDLVREPDHGFLFVMKRGAPMRAKVLSHLVKTYLERAGIKKKGACHLFRYSMATHLLEAGGEIKLIQQLLGHQQITTTDRYANMTIRKLKEMHSRLHPAKWKPATQKAQKKC